MELSIFFGDIFEDNLYPTLVKSHDLPLNFSKLREVCDNAKVDFTLQNSSSITFMYEGKTSD